MRTDRIDILTTQLAATDRRALSQAWYSALHLAEREPRAGAGHRRTGGVARRDDECESQAGPNGRVARCAVTVAAGRAQPLSRGAGRQPIETERRDPKTAIARRLERALARCSRRDAPWSFSLRAGNGRVHLVLRSDGARMRLVAICAPSMRERVERALAQARFALGGDGVTTEVI